MERLLWISAVMLMFLFGCSGEQVPDSQNGSGTKTVPLPKAAAGEDKVGISEFAKWQFLGMGDVQIDESEGAVSMSEAEGSKGVTLVSQKSYSQNVVVSFKVKPASYQSVNVVMLSASYKYTGEEIKVPADYDGSFGFWTLGYVQNYLFAFHNAAHGQKPFIVKDPGLFRLAEADEHVTGERWHDVEIGRNGLKLWMKIDGTVIAEAVDTDSKGLPGGKICFRLRGTEDSAASALFKDVVIKDE